jgi:RNA-binding protein
VDEAFNTRELLKVKVLDTAPLEQKAAATAVAQGLDGVQVVQVIGKTLVLYRPHPEEPEIQLPR